MNVHATHDEDRNLPLSAGEVLAERIDRDAGVIRAEALESVTSPSGQPTVQDYELPVPGARQNDPDTVFVVRGQQLGFGTSRSEQHRGHPDTTFMPPGAGRCSACRWFEVRIIRVESAVEVGGTYVVHTYGGSAVPGERPRCRAFITSSPYELVTFLTVHHNGHVYVPSASALALAQSAHWDTALRVACYHRETGLVTRLDSLRSGDNQAA